ncbi:serine/threonine-protein kinase [Actinomadura kijaniata]|uniref:serine/threonine-protein kinase n=1 Tax=Actinomadura kijaniata TaxID=46161 RepID=UPI0008362B91|nr:serine/threonine-protein kinase [Actinomadura kijaniata]
MADPAPLTPGDPRRLGPYTLTGRIGEGGQGVVYLGRSPDGRQVAVKLLHARFGADAEARARFARELATIERVAGFCTAQVLASDIAGDQPYIVSEYVPGPSLQQLVRERGPRTGTDLDRLAIGTATALTAIHRAGIVHRDFKPPNVLMAPDGPRVIDFGIARALDTHTATSSGLIGTPAFMAPEQVAGAPVDKPVDIFAWGATMVYAATGHSPYGHDTVPAVFNRILNHEPDLTALPPHLREIIASCLAKDPARRPTAQRLLLRLLGEETGADQAMAQGRSMAQQGWAAPLPPPQPIPFTPLTGPPGRDLPYGTFQPPIPHTVPPPPQRRRTGLAVLAAAAALVLLAGGGIGVWALNREDGKTGGTTTTTDTVDPPSRARQLQSQAAPALRNLLEFSNPTLDADIARANTQLTQRAQSRYAQWLNSARREFPDPSDKVVADVRDTAVIAASDDRVSLLSLVKRVRTGNRPTTGLEQVRFTMVPQGATWLIDEFDIMTPDVAPWSLGTVPWPGPAARAPMDAARACLKEIQTFDHRVFDKDMAEILTCSTGNYKAQTERERQQIKSRIEKGRVVSTGTPLEAAVKPGATADQATVLLSVAVNAQGTDGGRRVYGYWADMRREGGRWLLAKLDWLQ